MREFPVQRFGVITYYFEPATFRRTFRAKRADNDVTARLGTARDLSGNGLFVYSDFAASLRCYSTLLVASSEEHKQQVALELLGKVVRVSGDCSTTYLEGSQTLVAGGANYRRNGTSWWVGNIIPRMNSPTIIETRTRITIGEPKRIDSFLTQCGCLNLNSLDCGIRKLWVKTL